MELSEKAENTLVALVSLCEHRLTCLLENVPVRELNHLRSHVGITDTRLSCGGILNDIVKIADGGGILNDIVKIADGVLKSVLYSTEIRSLSVDLLDSILNVLDSSLSFIMSANLNLISSKSKSGCRHLGDADRNNLISSALCTNLKLLACE